MSKQEIKILPSTLADELNELLKNENWKCWLGEIKLQIGAPRRGKNDLESLFKFHTTKTDSSPPEYKTFPSVEKVRVRTKKLKLLN